MSWSRRAAIAALRLKKLNDTLARQLVEARAELQMAHRHRTGLEILLNTRGERITELNAKLDQSRLQVKRLDEENEHLALLFRETTTEPAAK